MKISWLGLLITLTALAGCGTGEVAAPPVGGGQDGLSVGILLIDGVFNSELTAPYDVFDHTRFYAKPGMNVFTVGRTRKPVRTFEGLVITPHHDLASAPSIDVLVIPSGEHNMTTDLEDLDLIQWISERGQKAKHVMSVCDGAFLLAEAGLLRDRRCTTFPGDIPAFRKEYPHIPVVEDVTFVVDGNTITGVGGARSYAPALYLVEKLYGKKAAEGVAGGLAQRWQLDGVSHFVAKGETPKTGRPSSYLPDDTVDANITVEDAEGNAVRLGDLVAGGAPAKGLVLYLVGGAEAKDVRKRGGMWCEDSFDDMPLLRHLILDYEPRGIRFVAVMCPPVYHEERFGYTKGAFLERAGDDPVYRENRLRFVERTLALQKTEVLPFKNVVFDPRFRLLANPKHGLPSAATGKAPPWQGRFKWYRDTQTYGTPTMWILTPDLIVFGKPFFMNVYESEGRKLNYTARDVGTRLDRLLK